MVVRVFAAGKEHLVHLVRFQPIGLVLRVVEVITHRRVDSVPHSNADSPVVRVVEARAKAVPGDHHVRPIAAQHAHDLAAKLGVGLEEAVGVAKEYDLLHSQHATGVPLLLLAQGG